jgi:hypothetical protein
MTKKYRLSALGLLAGGALVLGMHPAFASSVEVPFNASFSGGAAITSPSTSAFTGSGHATLMGRTTSAGHADFLPPEDSHCQGGVPNTNYETLTAVNGDTLSIVSDDVACPTGAWRFHGSGHWHVSGGTGRFANTTGEGTFDGHSDFTAGTFAATVSGKIVLRD